ncbi:MAG TPA: WbqC family protein [Sphingomicrobium sp.]|jgi:hypothetical protein
MQPYFYPYLPYFALLAGASTFVIFDCVQFSRRGRVHRSEVTKSEGRPKWLTLPLAAQPRDILIRDLRFAAEATAEFDRRLRSNPVIRDIMHRLPQAVRDHLTSDLQDPADYLEQGLRIITDLLKFQPRIVRSSTFVIPDDVRGQDRVIALARASGAGSYLNAAGGADLYDSAKFAKAGLTLEFLPNYTGRHWHLLSALAKADLNDLALEARQIAAMRQSRPALKPGFAIALR